MIRSRCTLFAATMASAVLVTACGTQSVQDSSVPPSAVYTQPPMPAGATIAPPALPTPAQNCGDPTASLRPARDHAGPAVDRIRARGRLIVGLDTGSNLMSFRDPVTGRLEGFDVDIAREVARDLLGDPERIEYRILTSDDRIQALMDSTVDIVVKTMTITCERREKVEFSTEYFAARQKILVLRTSGIRGIDDVADKRVCVARGTTSLARIQDLQPRATVVAVPMWSDCLVVLQQGQVDAISTDDSILAGLASQDPYLEMVGGALGTEPYGIGINKADTDLVRFVNGTLDRIRADGTWTRIYDRRLAVLGPAPVPPPAVYRD
ncbi:polar amino acid transport system substrate-binding protein [Rhodococcus sp. 27YEA15]|uniref:glutamate ABC transporter substrate-binding protein n=1 Tax=Rhodococcus sp. 27YEA15 TaxID=3156259 RepID=UPI003C7A0F24